MYEQGWCIVHFVLFCDQCCISNHTIDTFRLQIRGILPKLVTLLSEPLKPVRDAVLHLLDLMDQGDL